MAIVLKVKDDGSVVVEKFGQKAEKAFGKTGKGADRADGKWKSFSNNATKYGGIISSALAIVASAGIIKNLFDENKEFEKLDASLKTVTGSAAGAKTAFAVIDKFSANTPFQLNEVVASFIKLKSLGLDPSEAALLSYGNTASAMGKSLNQVIEAVADAATGEFERLKEFGIRAKQEGDQVTFTFQGVETTVRKDAASIEGYLRSIGDVQFAGAMAEQMDTLGGVMSNLQDSFSRLARSIGAGGFNDVVRTLIRDASNFVNVLAGVPDSIDKVSPAVKSLVQTTTDLSNAMDLLPGSVDASGTAMSVLSRIAVGLSQTFELLGTGIGGSAAALVQFVTGDFSQASDTISRMLDDMDAIALRGADLINQISEANTSDANAAGSASNDQAIAGDSGDGAIVSGRGDREAAQTELLREKLLEQVDLLAESQLSEEELLVEKYANEQSLLDDALETKAISEQRFMQLSLASTQNFEVSKTAIKEKQDKKRLAAEAKVNKAKKKFDDTRNKAELAGRQQVYTQGLNLLRRFADDNKAITLLLIALQTAKTVSDIQSNATAQTAAVTATAMAASAQIIAYSQIEAAAIMAMKPLVGAPLAAAALAKGLTSAAGVMAESVATVASIEGSALLASGLAIAGGIVDAIDASAGAPGSSTNPINVTNPDVTAADFTVDANPIDQAVNNAINTSVSANTFDSGVEPPPILTPAQQQAVIAQPREIDLTLSGSNIYDSEQFADGVDKVLSQLFLDGNYTLNVEVV